MPCSFEIVKSMPPISVRVYETLNYLHDWSKVMKKKQFNFSFKRSHKRAVCLNWWGDWSFIIVPTTYGQLILVICTLRNEVTTNILMQVTKSLSSEMPRKTKGEVMKAMFIWSNRLTLFLLIKDSHNVSTSDKLVDAQNIKPALANDLLM